VEHQTQYVGIDLHRRRSVIVRRNGAGETLDTVRIDNDPVVLAAELAKAGEHPEVILEATYGWYWAADVIQECGGTVHLAHPLGNNWGNRRVKNDERDATDLVDLLRLGRLAEAWIAPPPLRELREHIRYRAKLVHLRTNLKSQVHAVLAKEGVAVPMTDLFGVGGPGPPRRGASGRRLPGACRIVAGPDRARQSRDRHARGADRSLLRW
jgi:transposase